MSAIGKDRITNSEIKEAISRSGYLIEQRVTNVLSKDYFVRPNHTYLEPISGKTREIDLKVDSTLSWNEELNSRGVYFSVLCECENNLQPIVFFPFRPLMPNTASALVKCFGMPMKIWKDDQYIDLLKYLPLHNFHHYCKGDVATQYCSFTKRKDRAKWIATHLEEQHDTFNSLVYATEYEIDQFYSENWQPPVSDEIEPILIELIYPLLVLGGELMEAYIGRRGLVTKKIKHMQFLNNTHISGREVNYKIDVITEDYLSEYFAMIEYEINKLKRLITRHKKILTQSIERIISDVKSTGKVDSYKKLLTEE